MILELKSEIHSFYYELISCGFYDGGDVNNIIDSLVEDIDDVVKTTLDEFYRINVFVDVDYDAISKKIYDKFDVSGIFAKGQAPFPMFKQKEQEVSDSGNEVETMTEFDRDMFEANEDLDDDEDVDTTEREISIFAASITRERKTKSRIDEKRKSMMMDRVSKVKEGVRQISTKVGKEFESNNDANRIISELEGFLESELSNVFDLYEDEYLI